MYKETIFSREDLQSAMDALDRLEKEYTIKRINAVEVDDGKVSMLMSKVRNPERFDRWVIEEVTHKVELIVETGLDKETFYNEHGVIVAVKE